MASIRSMTAADWPQVEAIFAAGILGGEATFESTTPAWEQFDAGRVADPRLVVLDDAGSVTGWAAGSRVSPRAASMRRTSDGSSVFPQYWYSARISSAVPQVVTSPHTRTTLGRLMPVLVSYVT